jgi:hypothetical protein
MQSLRRLIAATFVACGVASVAIHAGDTKVSVGSPVTPFAHNKQNEPALAVDAHAPNVMAAGANDEIDVEACNAGDPTTCDFTHGVGVSGIYFSFDNGATWTQPTYTGYTARDCNAGACTGHPGPIGTLPWYWENGLVSDGDPALAFGPRRGSDGSFSWANGSRLYYANLASNFATTRNDQSFRGVEALAVSRTDDVVGAAAGNKDAWMPPVIVARQSSTTFSDKEQIWADNAASSPYFGNVYVCAAVFRSNSRGYGLPVPLIVATSRDGGDTWTQKQVTEPVFNVLRPDRSGCTIRTDSHGVVYVFATQFAYGLPGTGSHIMVKSFDGGQTWSRPTAIFDVVDSCFVVDPLIGRCVSDGVAGARNDLASAPSIDIANGAPTGADATNEIIDTWVDGRAGLNHETVMFSYSTNGGRTWSGPQIVSTAGDRGYYAAAAISPDGTDAYIVYNAFLLPFQETTATARPMQGVVLHANIGGNGAPSAWGTLLRGGVGDARGSSQNDLLGEFLGDYVYTVATRDYGAAVWNDVRDAADCAALDAWRQSLIAEAPIAAPSPNADCPALWGNSDIFGGSFPDPTP